MNRFQLASLAAEIFEKNITGEDMQALWKWNIDGSTLGGFDDQEIDSLLKHLLA
jgi:hypothetical protein